MKHNKLTKQHRLNVLALSIISSTLPAACNGGSNSSTNNTVVNNSPLAEYKASLTYTSVEAKQKLSSLRAAGDTKQQSFTVPNDVANAKLNLLSVRVTAFSDSSCKFGSELGVVDMNGGGTGVDFPVGSYSSSNSSNNSLYSRMLAAMAGKTPSTPELASGMRFDYKYNIQNGGTGWVSDPCMATGLANYETSALGVACTGGSTDCGFKVAQADPLPWVYRRVVYVTAMTTNGNIMATANALPTGPNVETGIAGGNYICNYDSNKPARSAGAVFKAALFPQPVTKPDKSYYRNDYTTAITGAGFSSNFLGATLQGIYPTDAHFINSGAYSLSNSIDPLVLDPIVWVGNNAGGGEYYLCQAQADLTNGEPWTDGTENSLGGRGSVSLKPVMRGDGFNAQSWNANHAYTCEYEYALICVQQDSD